jgi:SAM-dependent methyltransferase
MKRHKYRSLSIVIVLVVMMAVMAWTGVDRWRGGGFSATGPEMPRLRQALNLKAGMSVADVGSGSGDLTLALAAEVGPAGRVFSSDIDPIALDQVRRRVEAAGLRHVTLVEANTHTTGLPANCCDAIVLRRVYHHLSDPAATNADLRRSLRPGAALAVIDFPPTLGWLWPWPPPGVPKNRQGHGVTAEIVVSEVTASGFDLVQLFDDWPGRGPLASYCAVFRRDSKPVSRSLTAARVEITPSEPAARTRPYPSSTARSHPAAFA